jgi:DNA-binding NtrC family response regulator
VKTAKHRILLADDEDTLRTNLAEVLEEEGFEVVACRNGTEAIKALKNNSLDAIITDLRMPGATGMTLIERAKELVPDACIIVVTAYGEVETAVEAMRMGAREYICKPVIFDELIFKLKQLLAHGALEKENKLLKEQIRKTRFDHEIIGVSPAMASIKETVRRIAGTLSNVLICGESGTGKEVLARAIHYSGVTADKPFQAVNCGGLVDSLVESELFGHRKGAFTGADYDRPGYFECADSGTLFLDEIGNLPLVSQAVLLRAIEERAVTRVGDHRPRTVNLRIIAATNRDLQVAIAQGQFREDLYYRLNVIKLEVPPLRDRSEDIVALTHHFVAKLNRELQCDCQGFDEEAMAALCRHPWRGNVRELVNVIERAMIFADGEKVGIDNLFFLDKGPAETDNGDPVNLKAAMREFEKRHITRVLTSFGNNKIETAESLGIGVSSLYRKIEELDIGKSTTDSNHGLPGGSDVKLSVG